MGAIADAIVAYVQPLLEQTDGSHAEMSKAFALGQFCYNLALLPIESRDQVLSEMQANLDLDDAEFDEFQRTLVAPMLRRHQEMFPRMRERLSGNLSQSAPSLPAQQRTSAPGEKHAGTDRYAPCPCNSGEKYKFCCGVKRR
jgi:hypothetical protein